MSRQFILLVGMLLSLTGGTNLGEACAQNVVQDGAIRLIVRGDDIGSCHAANVACIKAYEQGIMTSVELMVPCPWFLEAVSLLNKHPKLDVGVHLTLTSEWENYKWRPLTWAPSLTDADGYFYPMIWQRKDMPPGTALKNADWKIEEIEKEMRAQIERALRRVPHISHLTYHMGCASWDPQVAELCTKLARHYGLDVAPSEHGVQGTPGFRAAKTAEDRARRFVEMLEGLRPGTYLFVEHPGLDTPEMRAIGHRGYDDVAADRDGVTKVFTSKEVKNAVKELGIRLISYSDLKKMAAR